MTWKMKFGKRKMAAEIEKLLAWGEELLNAMTQEQRKTLGEKIINAASVLTTQDRVEVPKDRAELAAWFAMSFDATRAVSRKADEQRKRNGAPDQVLLTSEQAAIELTSILSEKLGLVEWVE